MNMFNLINMPARRSESGGGNGRVYDQWLGRFLSPDPFIQAPTYSQNYNRYSYAWNNPLKYTDPSGYHFEEYGEDHTNPMGGSKPDSPYVYESSTLDPNPAKVMFGNPYRMSNPAGNYRYNWGLGRYEDRYGQMVSTSEAMAWAGLYSTSASNSLVLTNYSITTEWENYVNGIKGENDFTTSYGVDIQIVNTFNLMQNEGANEINSTVAYPDMNKEFDRQLLQTYCQFKLWGIGKTLGQKLGILFTFMETDKMYDFKNYEESPFHISNMGEYGRYRHLIMSPDDSGNYNYGVAAQALNIPIGIAKFAPGLFKNSVRTWWNIEGGFDHIKDTRMIIRGYYHKF